MTVPNTDKTAITIHPRYKWYMLVLTALTGTLVLAAPGMSMAVLFSEISGDLHLNLVQVGWIWGGGALPGIVTCLLGGAITDRFGPRRVMMWTTLLLGMAIALRGLTNDFVSLMAATLVIGALSPLISTCAIKVCGLWFPQRQWGLANGIFTMGMAFGFLLSTLLSATVLSPLLGGWRNVMFFYAVVCLALLVPWFFSRLQPPKIGAVLADLPLGKSMAHILKLKNVWLLGLAMLGMGGCMQGMTGYLPLYLQGQGWSSASADGALSLLHASSMLCVLPLTMGSDRLKSRKGLLQVMFLLIIAGNALLSVANGWTVWSAVVLAGMVRDASMALVFTMAVEVEGVGVLYAGTATGFMVLNNNMGGFFASPVGNQLASVLPGLPFAFWAGLAVVGFAGLALVKAPPRNPTRVQTGLAEPEA